MDLKNTFVVLVIGIAILSGFSGVEAHIMKAQVQAGEILNRNTGYENTPWGSFLTGNLEFPIDENTEKTIQKYLGDLPEIVQQELQSFIITNKSLFPNLENLMYGLGTLLHEVARQQFIDGNGVNITNKIVENENYTHDEANLDKIDEAVKTWKESLFKNTDIAIVIFETIYNNANDPVQKEKIGKELSGLKENYQRLLKAREENKISKQELEASKQQFEVSKREAFEKSLDLYQRYKKDPKPGMEEVLFQVADNFKKLSPEELSLEIKEMIKEMDKIRAAKKNASQK
ncbi:MAG: hypothetical protein LBL79_06605 [Prevotella sp.]|jgi:hypothetical protein|nr:hypothetical protein [Prevotella sp.]